jgi:ammonia channel protein AmtB
MYPDMAAAATALVALMSVPGLAILCAGLMMRSNRPSNVILAITGGGLLWMGWNRFNGGDPSVAAW